jgi:hypothetical protein
MPIHGRRDVLNAIAAFRRAVEDAGRDPASIDVGVFGVPNDPTTIDAYRNAGVARCLLGVPSAPPDVVLPVLDASMPLLEIAS